MPDNLPQITIDEKDFEFSFIRADGPGGQNVNKVSSAVQLRYDLQSAALPKDVKARFQKFAGKRVTQEGVLVIEAKRHRTQEANRADAVSRFYALLQKALEKPKPRKKTKPTKASREKRLKQKKQRSLLKNLRKKQTIEDE